METQYRRGLLSPSLTSTFVIFTTAAINHSRRQSSATLDLENRYTKTILRAEHDGQTLALALGRQR